MNAATLSWGARPGSGPIHRPEQCPWQKETNRHEHVRTLDLSAGIIPFNPDYEHGVFLAA